MKPVSKRFAAIFAFAGFGLWAWAGQSFASQAPPPWVPLGDSTYGMLSQLETAGLLPVGSDQAPLTRLQVANRIVEARQKYREIVVAQADSDFLPPVDEIDNGASASTPAAGAAPAASSPQDLAKAEASLTSLEDAYQFELKSLQDARQGVEDKSKAVEADQYDLWNRLKGIVEYPTVSIHGLGRAFGISQQYYGDSALSFSPASHRYGTGYLDLEPMGVISKQLQWNAMFRLSSDFQSDDTTNTISIPRISASFTPDFMSLNLGDFEESYTPLTMWNRNNLDLKYMPEMWARQDDEYKYTSFLNDEPNWQFRGARVGTALQWPNSDLLDSFKVSAMADMIRNGFNDTAKGGVYFGAFQYTDWIFAGNSQLKLKRWYLGGASIQFSMDAYGVILDEPLDTDSPTAFYQKTNADTWAHQYLIGSLKPSVDVGLGDGMSAGAVWEGAFASYQDDKMNPLNIISDYAILAGPYFKFDHSKVSLSYLNVGPNYYSPLAQTRQDDIEISSPAASNISPDIFQNLLRGQYFLTDVPRAGGIFSFYDRTQDNTFPYGLATPNREGFGADFDVKTLEKEALKIEGSAYFVQEISDNLVVNTPGTAYTPVDGTVAAPDPKRSFVYINIGPSLNLAPFLGLTEDLELGTNVRYEKTDSAIGTLTNLWLVAGARVALFHGIELASGFSTESINGSEVGYDGTPLARASFLFDNSDLGKYSLFTINDGTIESLRFSAKLEVNRNSRFFLDYALSWGTDVPDYGTLGGTLRNQFMEATYEIEF